MVFSAIYEALPEGLKYPTNTAEIGPLIKIIRNVVIKNNGSLPQEERNCRIAEAPGKL